MKKIVLNFILIFFIAYAANAGLTISGNNEVCPNRDETYTITSTDPNVCTMSWSIQKKNSQGVFVQITWGVGSTLSYTFPHSGTGFTEYKITAGTTGGFACLINKSAEFIVKSRYPIPVVTGPSNLCPGETGVYTATVNSSCFHHKFEWQVPSGWTILSKTSVPPNKEKAVIKAPSTPGNYLIKARTWFDDVGERSSYGEKNVYIGPPTQIFATFNGPYSLSKGSTGTWTAHVSGDNLNCYPLSYKWYYRLPNSSSWILSTASGNSFTRNIYNNAYMQIKLEVSVNSPGSSAKGIYHDNITCSNCSSGGGGGGGDFPIPDLPFMTSSDSLDFEINYDRSNYLIDSENSYITRNTFDFNTNQILSYDLQGETSLDKKSISVDENLFKIYPNPTIDKFTISKLQSDDIDYNLKLYTLDGKILIESNFNFQSGSKHEMDVGKLSSGTYILNISSKNGLVSRKALVIK